MLAKKCEPRWLPLLAFPDQDEDLWKLGPKQNYLESHGMRGRGSS